MAGLDSVEGLKLLSSARSLELELSETIKAAGLFADDVKRLRIQTREAYKELILADLHLAQESDAEGAIWKVTYRVIEDYRGRLSALYKLGAANVNEVTAPIIEEFNAFLAEATGFYFELVKDLDNTFGLDVFSQIKRRNDPLFGLNLEPKSSTGKETEMRYLLKTYQKTLIYLGDLARYQELNVEKALREFEAARGFYKNAINILHTTGNPYNQLAVISAYEENDIAVVYYYYRRWAPCLKEANLASLVIPTPFLNALGNLDAKMSKLLKSGSGLQDIPTNTPALDLFTKYFLYSHAVLFKGHELQAFLTFKPTAVKTFKALIRSRELTLEQNLMITSINLASFGKLGSLRLQQEYLKYATKETVGKDLYERNALIFAVDMFKAYLENGIEALDKVPINRRRHEVAYESLPAGLKKTLPALYIYTQWTKSNIESVRNALSFAGTLEELGGELCHDSFWRKFKAFGQSLRRVMRKVRHAPSPSGVVLDEDIMLAGQLFGNVPFAIPSRFLLAQLSDTSRETKTGWRISRILKAATSITPHEPQALQKGAAKDRAQADIEEEVQPNDITEDSSGEDVFTFRGRQPQKSPKLSPQLGSSSPAAQAQLSPEDTAPVQTAFSFMDEDQEPFPSEAKQYVDSLVEDEVTFNPYSSLPLPPLFSQPQPSPYVHTSPFKLTQPLFQSPGATFSTQASGFLSCFEEDIWAPLGTPSYSRNGVEDLPFLGGLPSEKGRRISDSSFPYGPFHPSVQGSPRHPVGLSRAPPPGLAPAVASPFTLSHVRMTPDESRSPHAQMFGAYSSFLR
ncbi:hypothetical protein L0F63_000569 [Massospora cicadina]|nr:hypothetical protein L0F63_000569 [Massospora cicadina]